MGGRYHSLAVPTLAGREDFSGFCGVGGLGCGHDHLRGILSPRLYICLINVEDIVNYAKNCNNCVGFYSDDMLGEI